MASELNVCFLCPGQGSQRPGMLHRLPKHAAAEKTLHEASELLGSDILAIDSEQTIHSEVSVQLGLFVAAVATARVLQEEKVIPQVAAGLSIGAFAAAVICNSLSFEDGITIVQKRAHLMAKNFPQGYGMSAIIGLTENKVREIVQEIQTKNEPVFVSNINALQQIIVSGANGGLEKVQATALANGAQKAERLKASVPSHCELFQPVADELRMQLLTFKMNDPKIPYMSNVNARPLRTASRIANDLADNVAHGVRWHDSIGIAIELGCDVFIEMQPGNVLTRLGSGSFPDKRFIAAETTSLDYLSRFAGTADDK